MENNLILDLKSIEKADNVDGFFIVQSVTEGITTTQKPYLTLVLKNKTGEIEGKIWDSTEQHKEICQVGKIIKVRGSIREYRNVLQLNIQLVRRAKEEDNISLDDLLPTAPIDKEMVQMEIRNTISDFENEEIRLITNKIFDKFEKDFLVHVAAKSNHHNEVGGLAYHTFTMLNIAKKIAPLYPMVNKDFLYATIILHDIAKIIELDNIVAPTYSVEGSLIGHIVLIANEINLVANELMEEGKIDKESKVPTILISNVISHHGKKEYGSPVEPSTIEAELVHHIDMIDSRMNMISNALQGAEKHTFVNVKPMKRNFFVL